MRKQLEEQIRAVLTSAAGSDVAFWLLASVLVLVKLALTSDLPLQIILTPTDDSMYVERAFHLLSGEAFGPYDSTILVKYPGISLWLAAVRTLGIPFLLSVDAVYLPCDGASQLRSEPLAGPPVLCAVRFQSDHARDRVDTRDA